MLFSICFVALIGTSFAGQISFTPCGNVPVPEKVSVEGCDGTSCNLVVSNNVKLSVEFTSPVDASSAEVIHSLGEIFSFSNACETGLSCPLTKGQSYTHQHEAAVPYYARSAKEMMYSLQTAEGSPIVCFTFPVEVYLTAPPPAPTPVTAPVSVPEVIVVPDEIPTPEIVATLEPEIPVEVVTEV